MKIKLLRILFFFCINFPLFAAHIDTDNVIVSAIQFPDQNLQSEKEFLKMVGSYIDAAKKKKTDIVLFPELITLNLLSDSNQNHPSIGQLNNLIIFNDKYIEFLRSKAVATGMIIVGGSTVTHKRNKFYNTVIVAFPNGKIKTVDKHLLTPWELANHITGVSNEPILSFESTWGTVVILICYEAESSEILSKIAKFNPNLILIPSNTVGLSGLERVTIAARYAAISQFAYTVLTGVSSNLSKEKITRNDNSAQAIFATPQEHGYSLSPQYGDFNQSGVYTFKANIQKLQKDKLSLQVIFANRDYALQH